MTLSDQRPWLFQVYPELKEKIPFCSLGEYPSPVEPLRRLGEKLGAEIWIKRDDIASCVYGGNKCRMMEWIIPDAHKKKRKSLVTWGALGSNQVLSSVIYGTRDGFDDITAVYNRQPYQPYVKRNFLIATALGVKQKFAGNSFTYLARLAGTYFGKLLSGKRPYLIPLLGSSPLSVLAYANAALELKRQIDAGECPRPDFVYVTVGTGGTFAGLLLGSLLFGDIGKIVGVRILEPVFVNRPMVAWEVNRTLGFLKSMGVDTGRARIRPRDINLVSGYMGAGYAEKTPEAEESLRLLDESENITLDITYTAKTMAALMDHAARNPGSRYLFWHTLNTVALGDYTAKLPGVDEVPRCFQNELKQ